MATSYFNIKKLRRQSKQADATGPTSESATAPATASTNFSDTASPPAPAVSKPSEEPALSPVLDEEDEIFLQRLAAIAQEPEGTPPPLPNRPMVAADGGDLKVGKDAQEVIMGGANKVPLPMSPPEVLGDSTNKGKGKAADGGINRTKSVLSYFSKFKKTGDKDADTKGKDKKKGKLTDKDRARAANDLLTAAEGAKSSEANEAAKEEQDLTAILDQLNLGAVNNRVFSFSKESEELLNKFKLILVDLVNGVPTAYDDLVKLLTDSEGQLKKMYGSLPPFLQNLVTSLPTKVTAALGPEILAAQAEKPGFDAKQKSGVKSKSLPKIPSLKSLVTAQGAVATMLKSILNFLKLRFPVLLTGTNVVLSLAVFILLFVFWYCHKRGRETRLEKERLATDGTDPALDSSASSLNDGDSIFGNKTKGESSNTTNEQSQPPLITQDNQNASGNQSASVNDLPSVQHLPEPAAVPLSTPQESTPLKEAPLK
ncbi:hypothetical protein B0J11DRAFT_516688 [Dendryphion nanum]|uniref:Uncharacterized protein n=1 Tax=Dendryphion nanum TaxID=256645 RepID=A0A9P9EH02_9PLEO|nr:hypothetical protein B0J11DRAFT_516688 [Dendryphion nanum]